MESLVSGEPHTVWKEIAQDKAAQLQLSQIEMHERMLRIFQVGEYYWMIFNASDGAVEYCSDSIADVLHYLPGECSLALLLSLVHPDDLPHVTAFEATARDFFKRLSCEKVMKYKVQYSCRLKCRCGTYKRLLHQAVAEQCDGSGAVFRSLVVHTDITHLKRGNKMTLSFIGMDGEPTYHDVQPLCKFAPAKNVLTKREQEILVLLTQNKTTKEIASILHLSPETVSTHRKSMLKKTDTHHVLQLVQLGLEKGWV